MEKFKVGKYYRHRDGNCIHIITTAETTTYGYTLIAEVIGDMTFHAVGNEEKHAKGWFEIDEEEWINSFEKQIRREQRKKDSPRPPKDRIIKEGGEPPIPELNELEEIKLDGKNKN